MAPGTMLFARIAALLELLFLMSALVTGSAVRAAAPPRTLDPVRLLQADVDESPGVETVLASRRFGLFVLGARPPAPPLAWTELSCEQGARLSEEDVPRLLELSTLRASGLSPVDLVLRTLHVEHCGTLGQLEVLDRQGRALTPLVRVDVFKYWQ